MASLTQLAALADKELQCASFSDYCPNGLQVEGRDEVRFLVSGVTASMELIERGLQAGADALLVHHGYFWKGEPLPLTGMKRRRIAALLAADISLLAYHLPLDAHPQLGNNVQLANQLGLVVLGGMDASPRPLGNWGELDRPLTAEAFVRRIAERLDREPLHVGDPQRQVGRIAWCTGAAQNMIEAAHAMGAQAYLSGEVSEQTVHFARENGMHFFAAGHHATERYGVAALGDFLADQLGIRHRFIDCDNPA